MLSKTAYGIGELVSCVVTKWNRQCQYVPVKIYEDNLGAIAFSKNSIYCQRCKQVDTKHHFIHLTSSKK